MGRLIQEGSETPAELTQRPQRSMGFLCPQSCRSYAFEPARLQTYFSLEDTVEACAPEQAASCLGRSWRAHTVWLLNVVIDLDHVLMVTKSLDEVGGLLQVRVSQPHLCVGDEFLCTGHRTQAQGVQLLPHLMQ